MRGKLDKKRLRIVLYEGRGAEPLDDTQRLETLTALLESGHTITRPLPNGGVAAPLYAHLATSRSQPSVCLYRTWARHSTPTQSSTIPIDEITRHASARLRGADHRTHRQGHRPDAGG